MRNEIHLLMLLLMMASCSKEPSSFKPIGSFLGQTVETKYLIDISKDTTIITPQGTVFFVPANTFKESNQGLVEVGIKEVYTKKEMLKSGTSTISPSGKLMESGGMIYFEITPNQAFRNEVIIKIPSDGIDPQMEKFTGTPAASNGVINWTRESSLLNNALQESIVEGENLYGQHCTVCHSENLREGLTGPALGNVHLYRSREWLVNFTKNSQQMIANGDELGNCLFNMYGTVMISYEDTLSNEQINSIFLYIENESALNQIDSNEVEFVLECITDTTYWLNSLGDQIENGVDYIYYTNSDTIRQATPSGNITSAVDAILNYEIGITRSGWYNVDVFLKDQEEKDNQLIEIQQLNVSVKNRGQIKNMFVALVYEKRNIVVWLDRLSKDNFTLKYGNQNLFLLDEKAMFVVAGKRGEKYFFGTTALDIPQNLDYEVELKKYDEKTMEELLDLL